MYIITPFKIERNEGRFFYGAIYDEDGKLQINYVRNDEKTAFKSKNPDKISNLSFKTYKSLTHDLDYYLGYFFSSYGHFILETLPMLNVLIGNDKKGIFHYWNKNNYEKPNVFNLTDEFKFVLEFFKLLQIKSNRISFFTNESPKKIHCNLVKIPIKINKSISNVKPYEIVIKQIKSNIDLDKNISGKFLFLKRKNYRVKSVSEDYISKKLEKFGFISIYPENFSVSEQIQIFHNAKVLIGFAGSQLHNSMFCNKNNTKVVSLGDKKFSLLNAKGGFFSNQCIANYISRSQGYFIPYKEDLSEMINDIEILLQSFNEFSNLHFSNHFVSKSIVKFNVLNFKLSRIPCHLNIDERIGLYNLIKNNYKNNGEIWDINPGAGGSTYCFGSALDENKDIKNKKIKAFDLFDGESIRTFQNHPKISEYLATTNKPSDKGLFKYLLKDFSFVKDKQINLFKNFSEFDNFSSVEIMHLNAIKSFEVWRSILPVISNSLMCKNSYIIFQNFEKCNLPWQWHFVSLLIKEKKAILQTFFPGGTIHLKLIDKVPTALVKKSINFDFSVDEISNNIDFMIETLLKNQSYNFLFNSNFSNIVFGILAYSFFYINNVTLKDWYTKKIDNQFLKQNSVYHNDLFKKS